MALASVVVGVLGKFGTAIKDRQFGTVHPKRWREKTDTKEKPELKIKLVVGWFVAQ